MTTVTIRSTSQPNPVFPYHFIWGAPAPSMDPSIHQTDELEIILFICFLIINVINLIATFRYLFISDCCYGGRFQSIFCMKLWISSLSSRVISGIMFTKPVIVVKWTPSGWWDLRYASVSSHHLVGFHFPTMARLPNITLYMHVFLRLKVCPLC